MRREEGKRKGEMGRRGIEIKRKREEEREKQSRKGGGTGKRKRGRGRRDGKKDVEGGGSKRR